MTQSRVCVTCLNQVCVWDDSFSSVTWHNTGGRKTRLCVWHDFLTCACGTRWRRLTGCLKLQVNFWKRATNYRALLRKMTYKDKASYGSLPPIYDCLMCVFLCDMTHWSRLTWLSQVCDSVTVYSYVTWLTHHYQHDCRKCVTWLSQWYITVYITVSFVYSYVSDMTVSVWHNCLICVFLRGWHDCLIWV